MKVKFTGDGSYEGTFDGKTVPFGHGDVLEVSEDTAKELLARLEGGTAVWTAAENGAPVAPAPNKGKSAPASPITPDQPMAGAQA